MAASAPPAATVRRAALEAGIAPVHVAVRGGGRKHLVDVAIHPKRDVPSRLAHVPRGTAAALTRTGRLRSPYRPMCGQQSRRWREVSDFAPLPHCARCLAALRSAGADLASRPVEVAEQLLGLIGDAQTAEQLHDLRLPIVECTGAVGELAKAYRQRRTELEHDRMGRSA